MRLYACETTAAITIHVRDVTEIPPNFGGHAKRPLSLCGMPIAWDLRSPLRNVRCIDCQRKMLELERQMAT